ncbi:roadblock/LC7 domain-containing protein [Streptomyces microflavus]|uniref:roadblock/LC7 domain-containing protein n=1 Tax=Streptomyces microflavus TaxID=1919 RepID=UPI00382C715C
MKPARPDMTWVLNDLVNFPGARHAMILSADGLAQFHSEHVTRDLADYMAATGAGLASLCSSITKFASDTPTPWELNMTRTLGGFVFVIAAGEGSLLIASSQRDVDIDAFSDRMEAVIGRMSSGLGVSARQVGQG